MLNSIISESTFTDMEIILMQYNIEDIFTKYRDSIFAIGFNYFRNSFDADDIVQTTFYKLSRSSNEFDSEEHIRNWLIRVAVNECKSISLSPWKSRRENIDDYVQNLAVTDPDQGALFEEVMKMKKKYRQVLHLFYYEGYKTKEIADILNISESAARTRLSRARELLKNRLGEAWQNE